MPGSVSSQNFGLTQNVRSVRFTFSYSNLYVMTNSVNEIPKARELVCTGVGKWLHTLPSHPILGEPQGLCWRMLTRNKLLMVVHQLQWPQSYTSHLLWAFAWGLTSPVCLSICTGDKNTKLLMVQSPLLPISSHQHLSSRCDDFQHLMYSK